MTKNTLLLTLTVLILLFGGVSHIQAAEKHGASNKEQTDKPPSPSSPTPTTEISPTTNPSMTPSPSRGVPSPTPTAEPTSSPRISPTPTTIPTPTSSDSSSHTVTPTATPTPQPVQTVLGTSHSSDSDTSVLDVLYIPPAKPLPQDVKGEVYAERITAPEGFTYNLGKNLYSDSDLSPTQTQGMIKIAGVCLLAGLLCIQTGIDTWIKKHLSRFSHRKDLQYA